jgi:hypothetical protein
MQRLLAISTVAIVLACGSLARAGAVPPFQVGATTIAANDFNVHTVTFIGGQLGQVELHGYGPTSLIVAVYDDASNLLAAGDNSHGDPVVIFFAGYTGNYRIFVLNQWPIANLYAVATN